MTRGPILNHKPICRALAPEGWVYRGWLDGFYSFTTGSDTDGFFEMLLRTEDLTPENVKYMADNRLTRIKGFKQR